MRLLEITNDFPPTVGGIENYIYSIVARWKPDDLTVVARAGARAAGVTGAAQVDACLAAEVHRVPPPATMPTLLPTRALEDRILEILQDRPVDVVHFASPLPLALLGPRIRRATGIPYAVSVHGGEFVAGARLARPLMQRALGEAAVALPVSAFTDEAIHRLLPAPPPTRIVRPGVDPDRFAPGLDPAFRLPGAGPVILTVCRLVARKGPATLIGALPRVREEHPGAVLAVVGDGPDRRHLERLAADQGVPDAVSFLGAQPWGSLGRFYAAADVFALPTRERFGGLETEGFPLVYLEAAAAGLPTVAGDAGGVREAVIDGETGLVIDGRSVAETAHALLALLGDPAAARAMGARARQRVLRGFSWDVVVERFRAALGDYLP